MYKGSGFNLIFCLPKEKVAAIFAGAYWWTCSDFLLLLDYTGWSLISMFRVFLYIWYKERSKPINAFLL